MLSGRRVLLGLAVALHLFRVLGEGAWRRVPCVRDGHAGHHAGSEAVLHVTAEAESFRALIHLKSHMAPPQAREACEMGLTPDRIVRPWAHVNSPCHATRPHMAPAPAKPLDPRPASTPQEWEEAEGLQQHPAASNSTTRRAGGRHQVRTAGSVVVDLREFRSALPNMLHLHGVVVRPVTLEVRRRCICMPPARSDWPPDGVMRGGCDQVGDYVLTPEIVVERKSVCKSLGRHAPPGSRGCQLSVPFSGR